MSGSFSGFSEQPADRLALIEQIRVGLPFETVTAAAETLGLTIGDLAAFGIIPARTLSHSRQGGQFSPAQSDRVARFFRIWRRAVDTFGGGDQARRWLERPTRPLGDQAPMALLDTEEGARLVDDLLYRIDQGLAA
ncbi:antitoxin Xre/MbcA/ParS toxin-binding domain-containing protein [Iodidimonas sp. SYSU 1G8]|uniref:type II RES/Xre toxin-antitoxin system antitoxin n=1 Tax=Iodidimonas sp. SYSU 1G8 TaxID=3133967 RepID=UPI0031FECBAF